MGDAADDVYDSMERQSWTAGDHEEEPTFDALSHGEEMGVILFADDAWWWLDMTQARRGPITEADAYATALSYLTDEERAYAALIPRRIQKEPADE